jgi:hypothetical protein
MSAMQQNTLWSSLSIEVTGARSSLARVHLQVAQHLTRFYSGWAQCSTPTPHIQYNISAQLWGHEWMVQRRHVPALQRSDLVVRVAGRFLLLEQV